MITLSPETEALIRASAARAGKTPDQVIREALSEGRFPAAEPRQKASRLAEILAIAEESATRPLLDPRSPEIIGYDERGLPA